MATTLRWQDPPSMGEGAGGCGESPRAEEGMDTPAATRRAFLGTMLGVLWLLANGDGAVAAPVLGKPVPFSIAGLRRRAQELAAKPFDEHGAKIPETLAELTYDQYRDIRFRPDQGLWVDLNLPFVAQFFHLGLYYTEPVRLFEVSDGSAAPVTYSADLFDFGANHFEPPTGIDFAGFRYHYPLNRPDYKDEVVVFQGGTYFRAVGRGNLYGVSARGLAIGVAAEGGEEFPMFREFYLERPTPQSKTAVIYALLDSPSTTGVYTFTIRPGDITTTDVTFTLYPRVEISRVGFGALTSMYFFGPNDRVDVDDFRPEVHDNDGLAIWTGAGEWLWRPLMNPERLRVSNFIDDNPRGFGLLQRQRKFDAYEDLEARYELRPSVWVEPVGNWGSGVVELVEIPTDAEIHDNIIAFWSPSQPLEAKVEVSLAYRLHWGFNPPVRPTAAETVATRVGRGWDDNSRRFVIDFKGGKLDSLPADAPVAAVVSATSGTISHVVAQHNDVAGGWRAFFEIVPEGDKEIELRCFLKLGDEALTETWSYRWYA